MVTDGDGRKEQGLVVVDLHIDSDRPAVVVDDSVKDLVPHHAETQQDQRQPDQSVGGG